VRLAGEAGCCEVEGKVEVEFDVDGIGRDVIDCGCGAEGDEKISSWRLLGAVFGGGGGLDRLDAARGLGLVEPNPAPSGFGVGFTGKSESSAALDLRGPSAGVDFGLRADSGAEGNPIERGWTDESAFREVWLATPPADGRLEGDREPDPGFVTPEEDPEGSRLGESA
jgi:hypothetical protein